MTSDFPPDTPKVCEACAGDLSQNCHWCNHGFMSIEQLTGWKEFRRGMRKMSVTYSMFENIIGDLIERLNDHGIPEAYDLALHLKVTLKQWREAPSDSEEREKTSKELMRLHRMAMGIIAR